ncbi:MAG: OmpH family outer membrane protein [Akkermansiaceae bacterium]|nr:OmpH family outer membrane protein [Armatimonadota bacterium]
MVKVFPALKKSLLPIFVITTSILIGGTVSAVPVAAAPADTMQFGMVDVGKVLNDSKSRSAVASELQRTERSYTAILQRLAQGSARFLTDPEITELGTLYEKDKPTEAEQKRISQLEAKGDQQKREMTTLQNTPKPDDAQTARFTLLNDTYEKGGASLQQFNRALSTKLQEKARDAEQKALVTVRTAVAKVAKAKGLSVVFTGDIAIYATVDITDDVLKEVNK